MKPYYEDAKSGIVIYHADAREVLGSLPSESSAVITDPPYGVGFKYATYVDDDESFCAVVDAVTECLGKWPTALSMSMRNLWKFPAPKWMACWHKPGSMRRNSVGGFSIWEPVLLYGAGWSFANDAITLPDCVNHDGGNQHPCPKPLRLLKWLAMGTKAETLIDPFAGSGTTLRAAKDLGRRAIGIEICEAYCEIAARRLDQQVLNFKD